MPKVENKLVNRGPAGLLAKLPGQVQAAVDASRDAHAEAANKVVTEAPKDRIRCGGTVLSLSKLKPDPTNARLHPERNVQAVMLSLAQHGQMSPITVRKQNMTVMKGNCTMESAKRLGWTKLACSVIEMTDAEAAAYGLADNRTSELGAWDHDVMAKLDQLIRESGEFEDAGLIGWTLDELAMLRANMDDLMPGGGQTWQELWEGMPEFIQEDQTSFKSIVVHFRSEEDFLGFMELVGQPPTNVRQKSIWHPEAEIARFADKRWVSAASLAGANGDGAEDGPAGEEDDADGSE